MTFKRLHTVLPALALGLGTAAASAAPVSFFDGTFNLANYSQLSYTTDPTVTITASQLTSGGNPGDALSVQFAIPGGPVSLESYQGFVNTAFTYDPSVQGPVAGIDFSSDRYVDYGSVLNPLITTLSRPLLLQSGQAYLAPFLDPQVRSAWFTSAKSGLTAADFAGFDFGTGAINAAAHPDFSAGGAPIEFGLASRLLLNLPTGLGAPLTAEYRFDNLAITLNPAATVPEPPTWALIGLALPALLWRRRPSAARPSAA
ncbi:MAG: PEP-CTERM sorting domain-containing protein [Burkholderiales bacterium]|nr:PEP-CTERM sorting domain-containing protein [Burkholderiales bacterium]